MGDLYIGGVGLSPGYWRAPEQTAGAFVAEPETGRRIYRTGDLARVEDGVVWFLGRADTQVKSRGYRIELGEIEAALSARAEVGECAVVGVGTEGFEGVSICSAVAPRVGMQIETAQVRVALRSDLPAYMIPARWLVLPRLPRNGSGKIDRLAIRRLFEEGADALSGAPLAADSLGRVIAGSSNERVAAVVADVLGINAPDFGIDLLEAGILDSLALIELIHALELEFGTEFPLEELDVERFRTLDTITQLVVEAAAFDSTDAA